MRQHKSQVADIIYGIGIWKSEITFVYFNMPESIGQIQRKLDRLYNISIKKIRVYLSKNNLIPRNGIGVKYKDVYYSGSELIEKINRDLKQIQ